ncbi:hypothetical protein [Burkholderia mayonis]|uniref:hypothetical protein n=1 Tax=Burkholderia mayonis TaxID=1385591 RepID=UPI000B2F85AF
MSQGTSPTRTRRKPDVAYARLVEVAAERGLTLLTLEWRGLKSYYEFRCASGHDVTRIGTVAMRGTITCLECEQMRVQDRFRELPSERGLVCHEGTYLGQTARQHFTCRSGHEWTTEARKILDGHGCPRCAKNELAAELLHSDGLERLHDAATERGGRCLTDTYNHGVEAVLAERLEALLTVGELPDLKQLQHEFAPSQAQCPDVAVDMSTAALYDRLIGEEVVSSGSRPLNSAQGARKRASNASFMINSL